MTAIPIHRQGMKMEPKRFWADLSENPAIRTDNLRIFPRKGDAHPAMEAFPVRVIPDDPDSRDAIKAIMVDVLCGGNGDGAGALRVAGLAMHGAANEKAHKILKALGWRAQKDHP